jgi:multidrug efflux pump subunit AcrA (membrane-fusion protein)
MKMRHLLLIIGGLVVLAILVCVGTAVIPGLINPGDSATPTASEDEEDVPTGITIRARGEIVPGTWADLSFDATGPVAEWLVEEGDTVEAGAILGRLDTESLERAVVKAENDLRQAELRLEQLQEPADEADIAAAEVAVEDAEAAYAEAIKNLSLTENSEAVGDEVRATRAARDDAFRTYQDLQAKYDRGEKWVSDEILSRAHDAYLDAEGAYQRAVQNSELRLLEARNAVAQAQRTLEQAQLDLEELQEGPAALDVQAAELEINAAQLALDEAEAALEDAALVAPFGGTVIELHLKEQDWTQPGTPAVTLADLKTLHVETTDLDEWGAAQVDIGGEVEIVFTAFDDKTLSGTITDVALRGEELPAGDVVYRVTIELDEPDPDLRWGMTVRITIPLE